MPGQLEQSGRVRGGFDIRSYHHDPGGATRLERDDDTPQGPRGGAWARQSPPPQPTRIARARIGRPREMPERSRVAADCTVGHILG